ncbi:hypothetical protein NUM3379_40760 [Kineococcus sp. NUM-3379]
MGDPDEDEEAGALDGADDLAGDGDAGPGDALHDGSHGGALCRSHRGAPAPGPPRPGAAGAARRCRGGRVQMRPAGAFAAAGAGGGA